MDGWSMALVTLVILVLPVILMVAFNGSDETDSRGRRVDSRWRVRD